MNRSSLSASLLVRALPEETKKVPCGITIHKNLHHSPKSGCQVRYSLRIRQPVFHLQVLHHHRIAHFLPGIHSQNFLHFLKLYRLSIPTLVMRLVPRKRKREVKKKIKKSETQRRKHPLSSENNHLSYLNYYFQIHFFYIS